jgi:hypothetical protein
MRKGGSISKQVQVFERAKIWLEVPKKLETRIYSAGEYQQKFTRPTDE